MMRDVKELAERLRQVAEVYRMDLKSPSVSATLDEAADALEATEQVAALQAQVAEARRQHGMPHPERWAMDCLMCRALSQPATDALEALKAEMWDKGVQTALNYAIRNDDGITLRLDEPHVNPYRKEGV